MVSENFRKRFVLLFSDVKPQVHVALRTARARHLSRSNLLSVVATGEYLNKRARDNTPVS